MADAQGAGTPPAETAAPPYWSQVLRALREVRGITREGWAARLGYGRTTVQRWERGEAVPDATAEAAILRACEEQGLFREFDSGPLQGRPVTPEWLRDLLAGARLRLSTRQAVAPTRAPAEGTRATPARPAAAVLRTEQPAGTVTFLFTDIEGSTRMAARLGDRYVGVLAAHRELLRVAFAAHGGHEVDTQGDAFFVVFPRASQAVAAAVDAQRALAAHPWPEGGTVRVRIGLHSGEATRTAEGYVGIDVHRAARICATGHGGQIVLSQVTAALAPQDLPAGATLRDLGEVRLRDLARREHMFQVTVPGMPADFPPLRSLESRPNNLPVPSTPLVGREVEVDVVRDLLRRDEVRVVTLTGPGGTGKTRLGLRAAVELLDDFADGVFFVALAPVTDPDMVIPGIAQAIGLAEEQGRSADEALKDALHTKAVLLMLDNFEQVMECAPRVADLLRTCPRVKALVTSRVVLRLSGERVVPVQPLTLPDPAHLPPLERLTQIPAVRLFLERAQAARPDFTLTRENAAAVAGICVRLNGLPLAIELAAARVRLLTSAALLDRLASPLRLLTGGARDLPERQQTMRGAIAWSHDLLGEHERILFRRLGVFAGTWTLEAAEDVCPGNGIDEFDILDLLTALVDSSLVTVEHRDDTVRYTMLDTIQEFAREQLTASGETATVCLRHRDWYLRLAEQLAPERVGPEQDAWAAQMEEDHDNFRAALAWCWTEGEGVAGLRLAGALGLFWSVRGHAEEGLGWLRRMLNAGAGAPTRVRVRAVARAGWLAWIRADLEPAALWLEESLALHQELGDKQRTAAAFMSLGRLVDLRGDQARAIDLFEESLAIYRQLHDQRGVAEALIRIGYAAFEQDDLDRATALCGESLELLRGLGDRYEMFDALSVLAMVAERRRDFPRASALYDDALLLAREAGSERRLADVLRTAGGLLSRMGDFPRALAYERESLMLARRRGVTVGIAGTVQTLAGTFLSMGQAERAARLLGAADALRESVGAPLPSVYLRMHQRALDLARRTLGDEAFEAAWAAGQTMPLDAVIAEALDERDA